VVDSIAFFLEAIEQAAVVGVGHLVGPQVGKLKKLKDELKVDALKFLEAPRDTLSSSTLVIWAMIHSWAALTVIQALFTRNCEVVEFQRNWLELRGAVDYFEKVIYKSEGN